MKLIGYFVSLLLLWTGALATSDNTKGAFFSSFQLFNTITGTYNCTDPAQWFLVSAELYVPKGNNQPLYFVVPNSFDNLPNGSFPLQSKTSQIGTITNTGSNNFTVSFNEGVTANQTATFNFLVKLTPEAQKNITEPQMLSYQFQVSSEKSFSTAINYIPKDMNVLSSDGGIFTENNTAWFIADLPLSSLNTASRFSSKPASTSTYKFNTDLTTYEIVLKVDELNRPLSSVPFTSLKDQSDSSQISIYINTKIEGGKYLRIKYYSKPLTSNSIANTISLKATDSENTRLAKRGDDSQVVTTNIYSGNQTNIEDPDDNEAQTVTINPLYSNDTANQNDTYETYSIISVTGSALLTQIGTWIPVSTLSSTSGSSVSTTSAKSISITSSSSSKDTTSISNTSVVISSMDRRSSSLSNITSANPIPSASSASSTSSTSKIITTSMTDILSSNTTSLNPSTITSSSTKFLNSSSTSITSVLSTVNTSGNSRANSTVPTTTSTSAHTSGTTSSTISDDSDSYVTYSIVSFTKDGQLTSFTSWFAVATETFSSSNLLTLKKTSSAESTISSTRTTSKARETSSNDSDFYQTYSLETKTISGEVIVSTNWFAVSTVTTSKSTFLSIDDLSSTGRASTTVSNVPTVSKKTYSNAKTVVSAESSNYETYSLVTKTKSGQALVSTQWAAISTEQYSTSHNETACTYCGTTTISPNSQEPSSFDSTSLVQQSSTFIIADNSTRPALTIYEGRAVQTTIGFGGLVLGFLFMLL